MSREVRNERFKSKKPPVPVDLCVPVVFAIDDETGRNAFVDTNIFVFPSNICNVECENVEITNRSITFNCDRVVVCIDYILCLKFFPKVGDPYCQSFQGCFAKEIKFKEFIKTFSHHRPLTLEEFLEAQGACIEVEPKRCFNKIFNLNRIDPCLTLIINFIKFNIRVKLFQERNVIVQGIVGEKVVRLPKEVESGCSFKTKNLLNDMVKRDTNVETSNMGEEVKSLLIPDIEKFKLEALEEFKNDLEKEYDDEE